MNTLRSFAIGLLMTFLGCGAAHAAGLTRGYVERACGFDNDHDGVAGEAGECDYCDGTTTDPDGDGNNETMVYTFCGSGTDNATCGTTGSPCATINYALNTRGPAKAIADGTDEIIVCFKGTACAAANIQVPDGDAGTTVAGPFGNENFAWTYATNPVRIIGWDDDNDGCYWPADDGSSPPSGCAATQTAADITTTSGANIAFAIEASGADNVLFAHFGTPNLNSWASNPIGVSDDDRSFIELNESANRIQFHDIDMSGTNSEQPLCGQTRIFDMSGPTTMSYIRLDNIDCTDCGGYFMRGPLGEGPGTDHGPVLLKNVTFVCHACDTLGQCGCDDAGCGGNDGWCTGPRQGCEVIKIWGNASKIRVLDSTFDADAGGGWTWDSPSSVTTILSGIVFNDNVRDFAIINTEMWNWKVAFLAQPDNDIGFTQRSVDDILIDRSYCLWNTAADSVLKSAGNAINECLKIESSNDTSSSCSPQPSCYTEAFVEDITVQNLVVRAKSDGTGDLRGAIGDGTGTNDGSCAAGGTDGTHTYRNITIHANQRWNSTGNTSALIHLGDNNSTQPTCNHARYILENIVIDGENPTDSRKNCVRVSTGVVGEVEDITFRNVTADGDCEFVCGGAAANTTIDAFATCATTTNTATTHDCSPLFTADEYHLSTSDICAYELGLDNSVNFILDIDDDTRTNPWDIGADEASVSGGGAVCGNSVIESGEQCDDGNETADGNCCSATCLWQAAATACTTDGLECTDDVCNATGTCTHGNTANGTACSTDSNGCTDDTCQSGLCDHTANSASCNDGVFCNGTDTCSGGACVVHTGDPCDGADGDADCSEMCNEAADACTTNDPAGSACPTDSNICTDDECDGAGTCAHTSNPANDPSCRSRTRMRAQCNCVFR